MGESKQEMADDNYFKWTACVAITQDAMCTNHFLNNRFWHICVTVFWMTEYKRILDVQRLSPGKTGDAPDMKDWVNAMVYDH